MERKIIQSVQPTQYSYYYIAASCCSVWVRLLCHFCYLYATLVDVYPSLYYNSHYVFQPNWPSSGAQLVCLWELLFFFSIVISSGSLFMLLTCCSPARVWFMVLLVSWFPLAQCVTLLEVFVVVWATAQWPKARQGAVTPTTSNTPKTATHWTKEKSTKP
jgi:hypothetical protein